MTHEEAQKELSRRRPFVTVLYNAKAQAFDRRGGLDINDPRFPRIAKWIRRRIHAGLHLECKGWGRDYRPNWILAG